MMYMLTYKNTYQRRTSPAHRIADFLNMVFARLRK